MYDGVDINECASGEKLCHRNASCFNKVGDYKCNCLDGFTGDGVFKCVGTF